MQLVTILQRKHCERFVHGQPSGARVLLCCSLGLGLVKAKSVVSGTQTFLDFLNSLGDNRSSTETKHLALPTSENLSKKKEGEEKKNPEKEKQGKIGLSKSTRQHPTHLRERMRDVNDSENEK